MKVKIMNSGKQSLPSYETELSAGMDLKADIDEPIILKPMERVLIPTGIHIQLPDGYEAQVRSRSGLAIKKGIVCVFGTVDADYTGGIGAILFNFGNSNFVINPGDRIAQLVINKFEKVGWEEVDKLEKTARGDGGFGHTGIG